MDFLSSVDTYDSDEAAKLLWSRFEERIGSTEGYAFYQHPILATATNTMPDFTIVGRGLRPLVIRILHADVESLSIDDADRWFVNDREVDSPLLELEDFIVALTNKIEADRELRDSTEVLGVLFTPHLAPGQMPTRIRDICDALSREIVIVSSGANIDEAVQSMDDLSEEQWLRLKSVAQGMHAFNRNRVATGNRIAKSRSEAIRMLENEIKLLDDEQLRVGMQIAPGPQRVRGLAGTGKTVVLAMKAANLHIRYPQAKILFTFHTQSLYNQARALITRFYRDQRETDPNWDVLHIRHGWGGRERPGVYYDACRRARVQPLNFKQAVALDPQEPLNACCAELLSHNIDPFYDYVLMDEAQDFPAHFFQLVGKLAKSEKTRRIYFAYDELQSLSHLEVPNPEDQFGVDEFGVPVVSISGDDYAGGIEKDFVLHRSYRCPLDVLVLAHAIGLGIHRPPQPVQMLTNRTSWENVGYQVAEGDLEPGQRVRITRLIENSPNRIRELYPTGPPLIDVRPSFESRDAELRWVAQAIHSLISVEAIPPEKIVVISLNSRSARSFFGRLETMLMQVGVASTTPGFGDVTWEFAEEGRVTLSTVYRAKGNEAPFVFIIGSDALYSYEDPVENRNRAFTSFSRSKAWLTITGSGLNMTKAETEIRAVLADMPSMCFEFPNTEELQIRRLDASETSRRRKDVATARKSIDQLLHVEGDALDDIDEEKLRVLYEKLSSRFSS